MSPALITKMLHSRGALVVTAVVVALLTLPAYALSTGTMSFETHGFVAKWSKLWQLAPFTNMCLQLSLNAVLVWLAMHLNRVYNLLRSFTMLQGVFFLVMQLATPALMLCVCPGTVLAIVVVACIASIFMVYDNGFFDTRNVFLVFLLLSACMSFDYCCALFIPVFLIACGQMRIYCLRTLVAIVLGLLTPWIIFLGFGLITFSDITVPDINLRVPSINTPQASLMVVTVLYTCFITVGSIVQNVIKIMTYNARSRAMLNVFTTVAVVTVLASIIDFANIYSYLTLLNCCAAFQLAHLFGAIHTFAKSYIAILVIAALYLILYIMQLVMML